MKLQLSQFYKYVLVGMILILVYVYVKPAGPVTASKIHLIYEPTRSNCQVTFQLQNELEQDVIVNLTLIIRRQDKNANTGWVLVGRREMTMKLAGSDWDYYTENISCSHTGTPDILLRKVIKLNKIAY